MVFCFVLKCECKGERVLRAVVMPLGWGVGEDCAAGRLCTLVVVFVVCLGQELLTWRDSGRAGFGDIRDWRGSLGSVFGGKSSLRFEVGR